MGSQGWLQAGQRVNAAAINLIIRGLSRNIMLYEWNATPHNMQVNDLLGL